MDNQNSSQMPPQSPPVNQPAQTPPTQTAPQPASPPTKSFLANKFIWLIVILIILLTGGGTYLALNSKPKPQPIVSKTTPTSAPTPTVDPTASWKTYQGIGFTFKYPTDWFFTEGTLYPKDGIIVSDSFSKNWTKPEIFRFSVMKDSPTYGKTANDFLKYVQDLIKNDGRSSTIVTSKEKVIGKNVNGIQIDSDDVNAGRIVVFDKNEELFTFSLINIRNDPAKVEENQKVIDQILSTFKFTDAIQATETSTWKTYTNTKVGFSIKYPSKYGSPQLPSGMAVSPKLYARGDEDDTNVIFGETSDDSYSIEFFPFLGNLPSLLRDPKGKDTPFFNWSNPSTASSTIKYISVDRVPGLLITAKYITGSDNQEHEAVLFTSKDHGFIIRVPPNYKLNDIDQILSTFKFTQ